MCVGGGRGREDMEGGTRGIPLPSIELAQPAVIPPVPLLILQPMYSIMLKNAWWFRSVVQHHDMQVTYLCAAGIC